MDLPVIKGEWGNPKIDYLKIFFELFLTGLSNTGKVFLDNFEKYTKIETLKTTV